MALLDIVNDGFVNTPEVKLFKLLTTVAFVKVEFGAFALLEVVA